MQVLCIAILGRSDWQAKTKIHRRLHPCSLRTLIKLHSVYVLDLQCWTSMTNRGSLTCGSVAVQLAVVGW